MRRDLAELPPLALPPGYAARPSRPGEEAAWAAVLDGCAQLGAWDAARVEQALARGIARERIWFVCDGEAPVATACVALHPRDAGTEAEIGWVAVLPEYQGQRLGAQVTLAACHAARALGFAEAFLLTDDYRLPAVKTYLNLGFQPDCWHESHAARWAALYQALKSP